MYRDAYPGDLRSSDVGRRVRLAGWVARRRDHGNLIFVDLRDRSGIVQLVVDPSFAPDAHAVAEHVRSEYVLGVRGEVVARSPETVNDHLPSGAIEVRVSAIEILNVARTPPFEIESAEDVDVDETLRLKYRYLDLRRSAMLANLELRHRAAQAARAFLNDQGSSRSRRRISRSPRRRAPATSWCRRGSSRTASTRCRSRHRC